MEKQQPAHLPFSIENILPASRSLTAESHQVWRRRGWTRPDQMSAIS